MVGQVGKLGKLLINYLPGRKSRKAIMDHGSCWSIKDGGI